MKVLLLCGNYLNSPEHPALKLFEGRTLLDAQIQRLMYLGFEPVTVVSGPESENLLSQSRLVEYSELVFDTNDPKSLPSHLRSGLFTSKEPTFALPVHILAPAKKIWQRMRTRMGQVEADVDWLRPYAPVHGEMTAGYPWLFTRHGNQKIKSATETPQLGTLSEFRVAVVDVSIFGDSQPFSAAMTPGPTALQAD